MRLFGAEVKAEWQYDFSVRVGLNSGLVIVGTIGDDLRMDYTAIGDTINLASRIEKEAAPGTIFATKNTQKLVRAFFEFIPKGKLTVKGKEQPVEAYELAGVGTI